MLRPDFLLHHLHRSFSLSLRLSLVASLARGLGLANQLRDVAATWSLNTLTGALTTPWRLSILTARRLGILATRGLNILLATGRLSILTARRLGILTTRGLNILATRSLRVLATRGLNILTASASQRPRRLNILAAWRLGVLASAGERARRLDILSLRDLGEHLLRLLHFGTGRLSVHRGRQGAEHCYTHDCCEESFHRSPVPSTLRLVCSH